MKILLATSNLGGGTGTHLVRLLEHMELPADSAKMICFGPRTLDPPEPVSLIDAAREGPLHRFPVAQWREYRQLRELARQFQPDLLHTFFFWPVIYGRLLKRAGIVRRLIENREDEGFNWSRSDYRFLRLTRSIPDRIICVSEGVRKVVLEREGVSGKQAVVIRNGVAFPPPDPGPHELQAVRSELGLSPQHQVVGMVANLNRPVKGVRYFVEAAPMIAEAAPHARLLIVGDGKLRTGLEQKARELGVADRIIFAGFHSNVSQFYGIMDISVLTSLSEGLSMTILESMSFGLPVVATSVGGNAELVRNEETGFLVPPKDPSRFARAVVTLLGAPDARRTMGDKARRIIEERFTLPAVADQYRSLYDHVAGNQPREELSS